MASRIAAGYGLEIFDVQFRREAPGKMDGGVLAPRALGDLAGRKDALHEAFAVPLERRRDTIDFRDVDAEPDDPHDAPPA